MSLVDPCLEVCPPPVCVEVWEAVGVQQMPAFAQGKTDGLANLCAQGTPAYAPLGDPFRLSRFRGEPGVGRIACTGEIRLRPDPALDRIGMEMPPDPRRIPELDAAFDNLTGRHVRFPESGE